MKLPFIIGLLFLFVTEVNAQAFRRSTHYLELGIMLGSTNYSGDVAGRDIELAETNIGYGFFARYHLNTQFFLKGQVYAGTISGDDKNIKRLAWRQFRFYSPIVEASLVAEWVPYAVEHVTVTGLHTYYFSPYIFAGVGGVTARPEPEYYGPPADRDRILLGPMPEEGERKRYFFPTVPIGFGMRFNYHERLTFGIEGGWRPVFSDILDGIRKNGNPDENDWYYFFGITAAYFINEPWKPLP